MKRTTHHSRLFFQTSLVAVFLMLALCQVQAATLKVTIEGIDGYTGKIRIDLFASETTWLKEAIHSINIPATEPEFVWLVEGLEPGVYGLYATHDVNGDGQLNRGVMGMPTEPYGFSNDARGSTGPAEWKKAQFTVGDGENTHTIRVE
jgi:uncharacterized protein (DUF2141 family)